jgi:tRNA threonylcarbamoyladenosine biosynthesis protein TsaB
MTFLAIETSDPRGSLALFDDRGCRAETLLPEGLFRAREITAQLDLLLRRLGLGPRDLEGIAVSAGPGSYTGCRVGITAAKSLAFALRVPVVTVSSLEAMAALAMGIDGGGCRLEGEASAVLEVGRLERFAPILDGRRGFFYAALFERGRSGRPTRILPDQVGKADAIAAELAGAGPAFVFGDGADELAESSGRLVRGPRDWDVPRASVLAELARERMQSARFDLEAIHSLAPAYLRPSEPEIVLARRLAREREAAASGRPR